MSHAADPLILELLSWLNLRPRTYAETMAVWRSSCPRHTVWEDALTGGLIELESTSDQGRVFLSAKGKALLLAAGETA